MRYQVCSQCVMDSSAAEFVSYGSDGCNFCINHRQRIQNELPAHKGPVALEDLVSRIKKSQRSSRYDCVVGLSGGVDSSYVALLLKEMGLNPIAVHVDNGWNTKTSVNNINRLVSHLDLELESSILDWQSFKAIQKAFLYSGLINLEAPTDHAITATLFQTAAKYNVQYILSGSNLATEGLMPASWGYDNKDWRLIKAVIRKYSDVSPAALPHLSLLDWSNHLILHQRKFIPLLNYVHFNKSSALSRMQHEFNYEPYATKHGESLFTKVFQNYILPLKCNIDKRRAHLSSQIASGLMTLSQASFILSSTNPVDHISSEELDFFCRKLELTRQDLDNYIQQPSISHHSFPNQEALLNHFQAQISSLKRSITSFD